MRKKNPEQKKNVPANNLYRNLNTEQECFNMKKAKYVNVKIKQSYLTHIYSIGQQKIKLKKIK